MEVDVPKDINNELEDRSIEFACSKQRRENILEKDEQSVKDLWYKNKKLPLISLVLQSERRERLRLKKVFSNNNNG